MFQNDELKNHLETSFTVSSQTSVIAEWNMSIPGNIFKTGNYRYRRNSTQYSALPNGFDRLDIGNFYTNADKNDIVVANGFQDDQVTPILFAYQSQREKLYYSLEDCFKPFRPRSGICKLSYFNNKYIPHPNKDMYLRPRYYMPHKDDEFKYWRSYRTESNYFVPYPTKFSAEGMLTEINGSGPWIGTISNLSSTAPLRVGKLFTASNASIILIDTAADVINVTGVGPWTATVDNLSSTDAVLIGDRIEAISGTGSLYGGSPTSVIVISKTASSVTYQVTGGSAPTAGSITNFRVISGSIGFEEVKVTEIIDNNTIKFSKKSGTPLVLGRIANLSTTIYPKIEESNIEYGISKNSDEGVYFIDDACPFVVYTEEVPANRIVVKVQTNIGTTNLGPFKNANESAFDDPFFGDANKTVPQRFKVQYLDNNNQWNDAFIVDQTSVREDGETPIFGADGFLSLEYGLDIPIQYKESFLMVDTYATAGLIPANTPKGNAFMVIPTPKARGTLHISNGNGGYDVYTPTYSWKLGSDGVYESTQFVTDLTDPDYFNETNDVSNIYREFVWIKGLRLAVESMSQPNIPLELIELAPRLAVDLSNKTINYTVTKMLSDLSSSALPVGQVNASTGNIELFDEDQAFNANNIWDGTKGSIVAKYAQKNIKFTFYEIIKNVGGLNYYIPIKTLYTEGFPQSDQKVGTISINMRDFFFYFESIKAPRILITEASLSQAICILLDSVGFSNYVFKRLPDETDPIIPYFFIAPEQNVAEVLSQLAIATQSAMFFDEYNNFVVMSKDYLLDESGTRDVDFVFYGSQNPSKVGITENTYQDMLSNIISVSSQSKKVYNAGTINYTTRYIQRSYGSLQESTHVDKSWVYKPALLWEVSGTESTRSLNAEKTQKFTLGAIPLNNDLTEEVPKVVNRQIVNNIIDIGENAYWITRYKGFLCSGGEIIKYDAVEHNVTGVGNVWISDNLEYQKYFADLPFNGKIYPTGLIRIYCEPYYETIDGYLKLKNGDVVSHGRGQFGTKVTSHSAGLDSYWSDKENIRGCQMDSQYLYTTEPNPSVPATEYGIAGSLNSRAQKSQVNGIIKNFMSSGYSTETNVGFLKTAQAATIQSSALVFNGPDFTSTENPRDFVSYVYKPLDGAYKHFGTRVRIIGKIETLGDRTQSPFGGMTYFNIPKTDPTQTISVGGGSAGIALVDPNTNVGYYFEIAALTTNKISSFLNTQDNGESTIVIDNVMFYKVERSAVGGTTDQSDAIPTKLWGGNANILVDDGNFTGQYRFIGEDNPTVYDLSIEYLDINENTRVFYLYINQKLVKVVTDTKPVKLVNSSVGLFIRGTSKAMFENVYALSKNYTSNAVFDLNTPIASIFGDDNYQLNASEALNKYAISNIIQKTYLSGVGSTTVPEYNLYFDEFGTILRECAYFNIKYDRAYPALYAQIAPTFNRLRGYTVSGFVADSYGAEFLVFNNTDSFLNLDETTGNYLRIQGIAFTQDTTNSVSVDDYLKRKGNFSDPELKGDVVIYSPFKATEEYDQIKVSRLQYGKNEFTLESPYIQDQATAESLLGWIVNKNLRPRKAVGLNVYPIPILQLGDIVNINYKDSDGTDIVARDDVKFVVYNIEYYKSVDGPSMLVYLNEV